MTVYRIPPGVQPVHHHGRFLLSTPQGGRIALDRNMLALWRLADGRESEQIVAQFQQQSDDPSLVRAALCCLAEADLLSREGENDKTIAHAPVNGPLVSVVIVGFNSREWLADCLPTVFSQTYSPLEIILIDNGSSDDTSSWVRQEFPDVHLVTLENTQSLAHSINLGVSHAAGSFFLLLNPDVKLEANALAEMMGIAKDDPTCAAVAAGLKFLWAPAFLNGIGNYVGAFSWGTDIGLGHLDLGQFDSMEEVPSACFASALIPREAWNKVGALDEGYPLYYEDTDWSYRARLLGFSIRTAPRSIVYHAFSGRVPSGGQRELSPQKLRRVAYGRLRFATKILERPRLLRFLRNYFIEDNLNIILALLRGQWGMMQAYLGAWRDYLNSIPELRHERSDLQSRRVCLDQELFQLQKNIPMSLIRNGLPQLTWDIIRSHYYPLFVLGKTHTFPEIAGLCESASGISQELPRQKVLRRAGRIWRAEGFSGLVHRVWRYTQWSLMQP